VSGRFIPGTLSQNLGNTANSLEIYGFILPSLVEKAIKTRFNE